ncbi:MAG: hypothetical protein IKQ58_03665 [Prevotella sp.]|nr:hypothetical protein [Bacteroidales bacterium]MBR6194548.1 hypothetical protein [Prevotella sp.]
MKRLGICLSLSVFVAFRYRGDAGLLEQQGGVGLGSPVPLTPCGAFR